MDLLKITSSLSVAKNIKKQNTNVAKTVQNLIYAKKTNKQYQL